jgi:hypothetical protein
MPRRSGKSNYLTGRRLDIGHRRRRPLSGSRGDLCTPLEPGHNKKLIGINLATKWSLELAPVRTSAAVHGGQTSIPSYDAWIDSKTSGGNACAHPKPAGPLDEVREGRSWGHGHVSRWTSPERNRSIPRLRVLPARFLLLEGCRCLAEAP